MQKKVAAVVVTYNRKELLEECMAALLAQTVAPDIFIIDNASDDGTDMLMQEIQQGHKEVSYYRMQENAGGAGGFNYGMKLAYEQGYEYIWLMDDDTIPQKDALEELLQAGRDIEENDNEEWGYLASQVKWTDGNLCTMNIPHFLEDGTLQEGRYKRIDWSTFVSMLVKCSLLEKIGLPIKEFFIWGDDKEYTGRITAAYNAYYVPDSIVVHMMKNNTGSDISLDEIGRIDRYVYAFRNEYYIAHHKNTEKKRINRYVLEYYRYVLGSIKAVLIKASNYKIKRITSILKGVYAGMHFEPEIEKMRNYR